MTPKEQATAYLAAKGKGGAAPTMANTASDAAGAAYLAMYPDVANKAIYRANPLAHYEQFGKAEGRTWGAPAAAAPVASNVQAAAEAVPAYQAMPEIFGNTPQSWDAYRSTAQAQTEGMNRMPGVFSNYQGVPTDPAVANELFYPQELQAGTMTNPLFQVAATPAKKK